ncbi:hypothetical protein [Gorillibacterium massiliense]|uniref:hypothetical protein n=1 Tax=Gorillibacterium massiliense TaxID=1280390 RepID=UPI000592C509|nr:hypothetical protein [Gorillibacterium massiliense]
MDLSNCKSCGRLMLQSKKYCEKCQNEKDEVYRSVRTFLSNHPGSTLLDVHRELGIAISELLEYVREFSAMPMGGYQTKQSDRKA